MAQAPCLLSLFIWIATYAAAPVEALRVIELKAPKSPTRGSTVTLECRYDLEKDQLYSVKWYKDGIEFLRYVPNDRPRIQAFKIRGLNVNVASSNDTTAVLDHVQNSASGNYSCEVSAEAPTFDVGVAEKRLVVAETPISIDQPPIGILGGSVRLNCAHNLGGSPLYSFKWFKDDKVFYTFTPGNRPPGKMFNVQGVTVDRLQGNYSSLYLKNLSALSAGAYRCEASFDAPPFLTVQDKKMLAVIKQRDMRPHITYDRESYQVGEFVRLNCTSSRSRPVPKLAVYVNDRLLIDADVRTKVDTHPDGFQVTTLSANIPVKQHDVSRAALRVKCQASFVGLYEAVAEMAIPVGQHTGDHKAPYQHQRSQHKQPSQRQSHLGPISSIQDECLTKAMEILARAWAAYQ
uniref:Putative beat protein like 1 n=1 Tax=Rhipicephalus microplus TaxID=6941 RepID=A0A6M2D6E3_RHIMP